MALLSSGLSLARACAALIQVTTWAWTSKAARRARPPRPRAARSTGTVGSDPTAARGSRANKNGDWRRSPETLSHSPLPLLSLRLVLSSQRSEHRAANRERARRSSGAASPGAVAGPLAGVRAPQRVSAPPSSGLAATPEWPVPASSTPRVRSSSPSPAK